MRWRKVYNRIRAILKRIFHREPKPQVFGIIFLENGKNQITEIYIGQTMHIEPFGACKADASCVHEEIEHIIPGKGTITVATKGTAIVFVDVTIRQIYER